MKKVLSLVLALALVLGSFVPAFAAENPYSEEGEILKNLGVFKGDQAGLRLDDELKRSELFTLISRLMGEEEEAASFPIKGSAIFSDSEGHWSDPIIGWAYAKGLTKGYPDGTVKPENVATVQETQLFLLRALGYENVDWVNVPATAAIAGVMGDIEAEGNATRGLLAGLTVNTLLAETTDGTILALDLGYEELIVPIAVEVVEFGEVPNGAALELPETVVVVYEDGSTQELAVVWDEYDTTVGGELVIEGAIEGTDLVAKATADVGAADLAVQSVTHDNLLQVFVEFNMDVADNKEVADFANYSLDLESIDNVKVDGSTAIVTFSDGVENQVDGTLTISEKILGQEEEFKFKFFDGELPKVLDITITGPKNFTVEFSEPIKTSGSITVKTGSSTLSVNSASIEGLGTKTISVPLYSTLIDGKPYSIGIKGFADYAGYNNITETVVVEYEKDETPPVVAMAEATQEYVRVEFSKPVKGLTTDHFSHTFTAWKAIKITGEDDFGATDLAASEDTKVVYVWFYGSGSDEYPIAEGTTSFRILSKANDIEIEDLWGNEFETETLNVSVTADKEAPSIVEIDVTGEDEFTIEFSKNVSFNEDNIEVTDLDGEEIKDVKVNVSGSGKEYTIDLGTSLAGETILVTIKNVEDTTLLENKLGTYSTTLDITDTTAPKVEMVTYEPANKMLYIFFDEDVTTDTALTAGNYYLVLNDAYTKLTKTPEFFNNSRTVRIELTTAQDSIAVDPATAVFVANVLDLDGNEVQDNLTDPVVDQSTNIPAMHEAVATAVDTVKVTFTQELAEVEMGAFLIGGNAPIAMEVTLDGSKTVVTFTLGSTDELEHDLGAGGVQVTYHNETLIENLFGISPANGEFEQIIDKIKPEVVTSGITTAGGIVSIQMSEDLDTNVNGNLYALDLVITNADGDELLAGVQYETALNLTDPSIIEITGLTATETYNIKSQDSITYIKDIPGNTAVPFTKAVEITVVP